MTGDYDVGYRKPPKHARFKAGTSGNPKGRPKGTKNLNTDLQEELAEHIQIKESGMGKTVSKQRALIKALMAKAVGGDIRAASLLLTLVLKVVPDAPEALLPTDLTAADKAILDAFRQEVLESAQTEKESTDADGS